MQKFGYFLFGALLLCGSACASPGDGAEKPLVARTYAAFEQDSARIHQQMQPGGVYEHTSASEQARVEERLNDMAKLLQAHSSESEMSQTDKIALLNAQEEINGILQHNDNNRLVCEHVAPVGSHRPVTKCQTYGEVMARQRADQKYVQDRSRTPQLKSGN
jgi:coenzyme F420-reducing hydrogenase alpha subunit